MSPDAWRCHAANGSEPTTYHDKRDAAGSTSDDDEGWLSGGAESRRRAADATTRAVGWLVLIAARPAGNATTVRAHGLPARPGWSSSKHPRLDDFSPRPGTPPISLRLRRNVAGFCLTRLGRNEGTFIHALLS